MEDDDFLEFDSLINIRLRQGNRSKDVENEEIRERIRQIVNKYMAYNYGKQQVKR